MSYIQYSIFVNMFNNKLGIFSILLFATLMLIPATSLVNAQEYDPYYEDNGYYGEEGYYSNPYRDGKDPIVKVSKELFICNDALNSPELFNCVTEFINPIGPNSEGFEESYTECTEETCLGIDTTDYAVQIWKDFAVVRDLTSEGTPVNLNKFHFAVVENRLDGIISTLGGCFATGFTDAVDFDKEFQNSTHFLDAEYNVCSLYIGDCDGTIYPGQIKECTVQNYIYQGTINSV
ncbi:MAG: hypothetical protein ACPKPY_06835 [Nitrososphaeraceae archaeon]